MTENTTMDLQAFMLRHAQQLYAVCEKIPSSLYAISLADDMLNLAMNAKVAANFLLRGYYPIIGRPVSMQEGFSDDKSEVLKQIQMVKETLSALPTVKGLHANKWHKEKAGLAAVDLSEPDFIYQYILPNFFFHFSMVYAIGRANSVALSKSDFDGIHQYNS